MKAWESNIRKVEPYVPGEQPKVQDVIKLNTNENPYGPSENVRKAMEAIDIDRCRLYPDPDVTKLVKSIADYYGMDNNQVFVGVGSDDVLSMCFLTFFNGKKPVLFPDITYSFYSVWADLYRIPYEKQKLDDNMKIVPEDYYKENGGVIFPNPNAPTGLLMDLDSVRDIIEHNKDVVVIVDEAYIDFGGASALPLIDKYDNVIVVQTFSKSRSLAGSRVGFAMADPQLIKYLNDVKYSFNSYTIDRITIETATAAIKDKEYFEETTKKVIEVREWTQKELRRLGFTFCDSKSNFIFAKPPEGIDTIKLFENLKADKIYVRHFNSPERIKDYLRISIGTDEQMRILINKLENYL